MCGIDIPDSIVIDGENIVEVLQGNRHDHKVVFTMKNDRIRTIRKGAWKMFIGEPEFHRSVDLANWVDKRTPDGTTIIAPVEQATPALYPGIKPWKICLLREGRYGMFIKLSTGSIKSFTKINSFYLYWKTSIM